MFAIEGKLLGVCPEKHSPRSCSAPAIRYLLLLLRGRGNVVIPRRRWLRNIWSWIQCHELLYISNQTSLVEGFPRISIASPLWLLFFLHEPKSRFDKWTVTGNMNTKRKRDACVGNIIASLLTAWHSLTLLDHSQENSRGQENLGRHNSYKTLDNGIFRSIIPPP